MPNEWMYTAAVPRTKSLTPHPAARFSGTVGDYELDGWTGVVSHNWGTEHAERWIYLHCGHFAGHDEHTWLEFVTGRIKLGPVTTPWIANGALQLDGVRHRLGGPQRARATKVDEQPTAARFVLTGDDGVRVEGELAAPKERFVGWRYASPDLDERHSLHCSIADLRLHVKRPGQARRRADRPRRRHLRARASGRTTATASRSSPTRTASSKARGAPLARPLRGVRGDARPRREGRRALQRGRGARPAHRRVDRLRLRRRPARRLPRPGVRRVDRRRARARRGPDRGAPARAARRRAGAARSPGRTRSPGRSAPSCSSPRCSRSGSSPPPRWPAASCPTRGRPAARSSSG